MLSWGVLTACTLQSLYNSTCWPLPCVQNNQLVTYSCTCTDAPVYGTSVYLWATNPLSTPFTGALKNFRTSAEKFKTWSKFQDISGEPLKFQEFQDNAQACILLFWPRFILSVNFFFSIKNIFAIPILLRISFIPCPSADIRLPKYLNWLTCFTCCP